MKPGDRLQADVRVGSDVHELPFVERQWAEPVGKAPCGPHNRLATCSYVVCRLLWNVLPSGNR
jgi:hypothetical protein